MFTKHFLKKSTVIFAVLLQVGCLFACQKTDANTGTAAVSTEVHQETSQHKEETSVMADIDILENLEAWNGTYQTKSDAMQVQGTLEIQADGNFHFGTFTGKIDGNILHAKLFMEVNADESGEPLYLFTLDSYLEGNEFTEYEVGATVFGMKKTGDDILTMVNNTKSVSDWQQIFYKVESN